MALKIPDASQIDVVNDLLMLKSHSEGKNPLRSQSTAYAQPNIGRSGAPYQVTSVEDPGWSTSITANFQSITFMEAYKNQSFEVKVLIVHKQDITNCI